MEAEFGPETFTAGVAVSRAALATARTGSHIAVFLKENPPPLELGPARLDAV